MSQLRPLMRRLFSTFPHASSFRFSPQLARRGERVQSTTRRFHVLLLHRPRTGEVPLHDMLAGYAGTCDLAQSRRRASHLFFSLATVAAAQQKQIWLVLIICRLPNAARPSLHPVSV